MERYAKGAVLGRGTFGEVIKATDNEVGRLGAEGGADHFVRTWQKQPPQHTHAALPPCRAATWWRSRRYGSGRRGR